MHYHIWVRTDLHTMERDNWRYQTRSAASKYIRRHLAGQGAMVLQCDRELGLSPRQMEMIYQRGLDVAEELVFRRGSWDVARATLEAAASRLTELLADEATDEEVGDGDLAFTFEENSAEIERFISRHILEVLSQATGFPLLG